MIDDYRIDDKEGILKYISVFYGSNKNYLSGETCDISSTHDFVLDSLLSVLKSDDVEEFDERANTIEVISNKSYVLSDVVECVILPESLLKNKSVKQWIKDYKINFKRYQTRKLCAPNRYNEVIFQKVIEYFQEGGYINE